MSDENDEPVVKTSELEDETISDQLSSLQKTIEIQKSDIAELKSVLKDKTAYANQVDQKLKRAVHEKEQSVMKFAVRESEVMKLKKAKSELEGKVEILSKTVYEKSNVERYNESKDDEVAQCKLDVEHWKDQYRLQEIKTSQWESKYVSEVKKHEATRNQLDITIKDLGLLRKEINVTRHECAQFMNKINADSDAQERKNKAENAKLIIDASTAQELTEKRQQVGRLTKEVDVLRVELNESRVSLKEERDSNHRLTEKCKEVERAVESLNLQVADVDSIRIHTKLQNEKLDQSRKECENLRSQMTSLQKDLDQSLEKERQSCASTLKLSDVNVALQSKLTSLKDRSEVLESRFEADRRRIISLSDEVDTLKLAFDSERDGRVSDNEALTKRIAAMEVMINKKRAEVEDAQNEIVLLKRKNAASIKNLTKELKNHIHLNDAGDGSLNSHSSAEKLKNNGHPENTSVTTPSHHQTSQKLSTLDDNSQSSDSMSIDNRFQQQQNMNVQLLMDKVTRLQRSLAKYEDKLESGDEKIQFLNDEVEKKNRVIQHYALSSHGGVSRNQTSPSIHDDITYDKVSISSQKSGESSYSYMGHLFSSTLTHVLPTSLNPYASSHGVGLMDLSGENGMTLEMAMEVNKKLQVVLEDVILKNIALKESMDVLTADNTADDT